MIHLKKYQDEAVNDLSKTFFKLLQKPGARHNLVFKAPTGAGKTVMMASLLNKVAEEIGERPAVQRGKMVNRAWGEPEEQLRERHDASDFEHCTQDKIAGDTE